MSRFRAAGIHLAISAAVALTVLSVMLAVWYPGVYFKLMGGAALLFILVAVDVCIGPLITLIVFQAGKKRLKLDLAVIAFLQLAALSYGVYVTAVARPVYVVFVGANGFRVATPADLEDTMLARAQPKWRELPLDGPRVIAADIPEDVDAQAAFMALKRAGVDRHVFPEAYRTYEDRQQEIRRAGRPLALLKGLSAENDRKLEAFLRERGLRAEDLLFLPVKGRVQMSVFIDAKTGALVDIADVDPNADVLSN